MKKGLIMEGGAMRGLFTCGVIDVLMENNIEFDGAGGISAGACFGINYKSKQPGRVMRYSKIYSRDKRYVSLWSYIHTGDIYGKEFCYHTLPEKLDVFDFDTFEKNPCEFFIGATDLETGEPVFKKLDTCKGDDMEWIRASASMPLVSHPVEIGGRKYLDGGMTEPLPYDYMRSLGYDRNLVILTQPLGFRKPKNKYMFLIKCNLRKYPKAIEAMATRHIKYDEIIDRIHEEERKGINFVICPDSKLQIKKTEKDPEKLEMVYNLGRKAAEAKLEELKAFLA